MKFLSRMLAAATSLVALVVAVQTAVDPQGGAAWAAGNLAAAAIVVAVGMVTWLHPMRPSVAAELLAGALLLVVIGVAGAVWTWHLRVVARDFDGPVMAASLLLATQGAATVWQLWSEARAESPTA